VDPAALALAIRAVLGDALREEVRAAVEAAITARLPEVIRRASLPPYLTRAEVCALTGWSERKVDYLRAERRLPFIRRGRTVLFPTSEVEAFLDAGHVPMRGEVPARRRRPRGATGADA
jgi:excisionase family DNA binding protein